MLGQAPYRWHCFWCDKISKTVVHMKHIDGTVVVKLTLDEYIKDRSFYDSTIKDLNHEG